MISYFTMTAPAGRRYLEIKRAGTEATFPEIVERRLPDGADLTTSPQYCLPTELDELRDALRAQSSEADADAAMFVHRMLRPVDRRILADWGFWTWLAVAWCEDLVELRHGKPGKPAVLENYGIGNRKENLLYRLWLRGEMAWRPDIVDEQAQYPLIRVGDADLWRSHLIRQNFANIPSLVDALLRLQAGQLAVRGQAVPGLKGGTHEEGMRKLVKLVRRLRENVALEYLDGNEVDELVADLASRCSGIEVLA